MLIKIVCDETPNYLAYSPGDVELIRGEDGLEKKVHNPGKVVSRLSNFEDRTKYDEEIVVRKGDNRIIQTEVENGSVLIAVRVTINKSGVPELKASQERAMPKLKKKIEGYDKKELETSLPSAKGIKQKNSGR